MRTRVAQIARLRLHIFVSQNRCHPRVMSRSLPHLTLTTSTSSLSLTSPIFPIISPTHGRVADQHKSHLSQVMSPNRSSPPKIIETNVIETEVIDLKTLNPEELSLKGILGQIRIKYRKDLWEITNLEKLVLRCPTSSDRCIPNVAQRKALQTRILKMENYEKCWLHHCFYRVEGIMNHLEKQRLQGKKKQ